MRLVLFLGAGFSRSAGFPLMREFSMFSQGLGGYEEHILCLHKCIEYAQRTRAYIHGDIYNVEYLMSVLSLAAITNPDLPFDIGEKRVTVTEALEILKQLVWRVYSRMERLPSWQDAYRLFVRALKKFKNEGDHSIEIVTTNYDMLPEMLMHAIGQQATTPDEFERIPLPDNFTTGHDLARKSVGDYSVYVKAGAKNLHKLHGSVNWFVKKDGNEGKAHCWDQMFSPIQDGILFHVPFCTTELAEIPEDFIPIIVPPSIIKEYKIPVILRAWQNASKAMANADKVVFIGYSFPPTDTVMKFFLGSSLANNQKGCRISIIDRNTAGVMGSLKDIFVDDICEHIDKINVEFKELIKQFPSWTDFPKYLES